MWGTGGEPARGTGVLPVAIGPDTGKMPVPHQMPDMSHGDEGTMCDAMPPNSHSVKIGESGLAHWRFWHLTGCENEQEPG